VQSRAFTWRNGAGSNQNNSADFNLCGNNKVQQAPNARKPERIQTYILEPVTRQATGGSTQRLALGNPIPNKFKSKIQPFDHGLFNGMAFMLSQIEHHVHIVPDVTRGQTIQCNTGHISQHVGREIRMRLGLLGYCLKHQPFVIVVHLFKIDNHEILQKNARHQAFNRITLAAPLASDKKNPGQKEKETRCGSGQESE
jgi:hypothetical protein